MPPSAPHSPLELAVRQSIRQPNTIRNYMSAVQSYLRHAGRDPRCWTGASVVAWRDQLVADGLAPRSVNTKLAGVRFASERAVALGHIEKDFAQAAELLPWVQEQKRHAVSVDVASKIMATCSGTTPPAIRDRAILSLGFYVGMRRESIAGLQVHDLDWGKGQITFVIKGGRRHTAPLDPQALPAIEQWLACCLDVEDESLRGHVFRQITRGVDDDWHIRGPMSADAINKVVQRRAKAAGVEQFHAHLMRHCFISWAFENGHSIEDIMLVTGHKDVSSLLAYRTDTRSITPRAKSLVPNLTKEP